MRDRVDELTDRIHELAGGPFTIGSPQQLGEVLFTRLGLPPARKGKTGFSTDASVLKTLREQHPIVAAVEEWRELTKLLNTYLDPLPQRLDPQTGRLHTTFNQTVASTGRLSSTNPNLQNIPIRGELGGEIRSCFVGRAGSQLVVADSSRSSCACSRTWPRSRRCSTRSAAGASTGDRLHGRRYAATSR